MTCPACGLELPAHARFCAACGAPQPAAQMAARRPAVEMWVIVVFGFGIVLTAGVAILYSAIALYPNSASTTMDPAALRQASVALASGGAVLCILQCFAMVGLVRGREWGRLAATAACVAWCFTCVGVPGAVLVLTSLWRGPRAPGAARQL